MPDPQSFAMLEQESGSFIATITDDVGAMLPGSVLTSLKLSLYVIRADGTLTYVNGRQQQNVLNANNVTVYDVLQALADGRTYNLRWKIQVSDTTLVATTMPYERHLVLFEWAWPDGAGKQEAVLTVKNLATL